MKWKKPYLFYTSAYFFLAFIIQDRIVYLKCTLNRQEYNIEKYGFPMYD